MVYVALLRGINVGGKNKIDMKTLKRVFEEAGMRSVVTYINSGNIVFEADDEPKMELMAKLEQAIAAQFGLSINVLLVNAEEMETIMEAVPESWTNDERMKSDVLFLWEEVNEASVMEQLAIKPGIDTAYYVPGAIIWSIDRQNAAKGAMVKIIGTDLYKRITVRNVNTARKIYSFMQEAKRSSR
ncbi:DUF1697 domain-containing protein [Indiicoccus explosivorum]|uniref:DUF1697 domain-containing protein n=1 Tax=Indiicoccus explosivorum TaxID=1917864 RepID=UPI000B43BCC4|nr:DUF1697 domain-containing protein [Indiicoccus explosivorum]